MSRIALKHLFHLGKRQESYFAVAIHSIESFWDDFTGCEEVVDILDS